MKFKLLLLFIIFINDLQAQSFLSKNTEYSIISHLTIQEDNSNRWLSPGPGFTIDSRMDLLIPIFSRLDLLTGLGLTIQLVRQKDYSPSNLFFPAQITDRQCDTRQCDTGHFKDRILHNALNVPVELKLRVLGKRNQLYIIAGVNGQVTIVDLEHRTLEECNNPSARVLDNNNDFSLFNLNQIYGLGFSWHTKNDSRFSLEPRISWGLEEQMISRNEIFLTSAGSQFAHLGLRLAYKPKYQ